ncbi:MAG: GntR family transcriptional regulator [Desulfobacteraceae bacterium]
MRKIDKPKPLAKIALDALRHSILNNELTSDTIYNEKGLAQTLGISRTPVREALLELSSRRLVRFLPQKGVVVNTFSAKDVEDLFEIRTALEIFSIRKICSSPESVETALLKKCLEEQKRAAGEDNPVAFMDADRKFHIGLTALADNGYLLEMMQNIRDIMHLMGFKALGMNGRMQEVINEHEDILHAVENREISDAMEKMDLHLDISKTQSKKSNSMRKRLASGAPTASQPAQQF